MPPKPTLASVAKAAGVSIPTVSQVMRGTGRISAQTRERVLSAAKSLHYVPDSRAASMRSGENREIGFVLNQFSNPFNAEVVSGTVELLEAESYLVSILDTRDDTERQSQQLEAFIRNGRGGLLWVPAQNTDDDTFALLKARGLPTVTFLRHVSPAFDHVGIRNTEATATAARYLADLGHRHIAYLGGTVSTTVRQDRIKGYEQVIAERGLGAPIIWPSADDKRAGLDAIGEIRRTHPDVTAIICNGDMVALGACFGLARMGLQPGRDISVIGFDGTEDAAVAIPALTTMAVSPKKLGYRLARMLLNRIENPGLALTVNEASAELVIRETTGPAPQ